LRTGLGGFLAELGERCRRIAARLVDAKASALASRIDEMPSRLLAVSAEERVDTAIAELGKLVVLTRAWRAAPDNPDLRREVVSSETRDEVMANAEAPRVASTWEVLGERIATRRDGLVSQATWLMNLKPGPQRFGVLLDFFLASAGRRSGAFVAGERFQAELAFYPGSAPLRAVIVSRDATEDAAVAWPEAPEDPFAEHASSSRFSRRSCRRTMPSSSRPSRTTRPIGCRPWRAPAWRDWAGRVAQERAPSSPRCSRSARSGSSADASNW
jgi:hypothetical protein